MIFTTDKRFTKKTTEPPITYAESPMMTFSSKYRNHMLRLQLQKQPEVEKRPKEIESISLEPTDPSKKPMKWGEPTWFLFHTLAEKVKPEYFQQIRQELLNLIFVICSNLPCPTCAKHAVEYMNGINFNAITTKEALRIVLYKFHNEVNRRKNMAEFPYEKVTEKYSSANTVNIIHHFMPYFENKSGSVRLIADNLHRSRVALQLKAWFNKNIGCFEL